MFKLKITNTHRSSPEYKLVNMETNELESIPHTNINKLFNNDVFIYDATNNKICEIIESPIRQQKDIPAVLIVANGKTYGREIIKNNKTNKATLGRLFYQCVPDDPALPIFLVPYEIKHLGFNKAIPNLYVTICFKEWTNKHPIGTLTQLIGAVNQLDHFYEYQLHCKALNTSIQNFNKAAINAIKTNEGSTLLFRSENDRSNNPVFTIDPSGCADFDDAFGVTRNPDDNSSILVSVYIANVAQILELLNLWPHVGERASTIYLPNGKRPMLPAILSEGLCSLKAGEKRRAFTLDIQLRKRTNKDRLEWIVESTALSNCLIQVKRNYVYEERDLLKNADYKLLLSISTELTKNADYSYLSAIDDSHDVVAYFMLFMNHYCAKQLQTMSAGILRRTESVSGPLINMDDIFVGEYIDAAATQDANLLRHSALHLDVYTHITSPIRRIADLLNMLITQQSLNLYAFSQDAIAFYDKWTNKLNYVNETMRKIKRVQNDCELLHLCNKNEAMLDKTYDGYCFDKRKAMVAAAAAAEMYEYSIYLPELRIVSRVRVTTELDMTKMYKCKLYMFHNEEKYKRKIRVQIIE